MPRVRIMKKNKKAQSEEEGRREIPSGQAMKASPGPGDIGTFI